MESNTNLGRAITERVNEMGYDGEIIEKGAIICPTTYQSHNNYYYKDATGWYTKMQTKLTQPIEQIFNDQKSADLATDLANKIAAELDKLRIIKMSNYLDKSENKIGLGLEDMEITAELAAEIADGLHHYGIDVEEEIAKTLTTEIEKAQKENAQKELEAIELQRNNINEMMHVYQDILDDRIALIDERYGDDIIKEARLLISQLHDLFQEQVKLHNVLKIEMMMDRMQSFVDNAVVSAMEESITSYLIRRNNAINGPLLDRKLISNDSLHKINTLKEEIKNDL